MIGKFKFVAFIEGQPDETIWEKDIDTARTALGEKFPGKTIKEILPNKEYLKRVKKLERATAKAEAIPAPANVQVQ